MALSVSMRAAAPPPRPRRTARRGLAAPPARSSPRSAAAFPRRAPPRIAALERESGRAIRLCVGAMSASWRVSGLRGDVGARDTSPRHALMPRRPRARCGGHDGDGGKAAASRRGRPRRAAAERAVLGRRLHAQCLVLAGRGAARASCPPPVASAISSVQHARAAGALGARGGGPRRVQDLGAEDGAAQPAAAVEAQPQLGEGATARADGSRHVGKRMERRHRRAGTVEQLDAARSARRLCVAQQPELRRHRRRRAARRAADEEDCLLPLQREHPVERARAERRRPTPRRPPAPPRAVPPTAAPPPSPRPRRPPRSVVAADGDQPRAEPRGAQPEVVAAPDEVHQRRRVGHRQLQRVARRGALVDHPQVGGARRWQRAPLLGRDLHRQLGGRAVARAACACRTSRPPRSKRQPPRCR